MPKRTTTTSGRNRNLRDSALVFSEEEHTYVKGDRKFISVTQFVKSFTPPFTPFDTERISAAIAKKTGRTKEAVLAEWKAKADYGTHVHALIEKYINREIQIHEIENRHAEEAIAALAKISNTYKYPKEFAEVRVYSEEHGIAGTIDLLLLQEDKEFILVDWKTNQTIRGAGETFKHNDELRNLPDHSFSHYTLQLSLYAYILETEYSLKCKRLKLVHLLDNKSNTYDIVYCKDIIEQMLKEAKQHGTTN